MNQVIAYYEKHEENTAITGYYSMKELKKSYAECFHMGDGYYFCRTEMKRVGDSNYHYVSCWKQIEKNVYQLIMRSKNALNTADLGDQFSWMRRVMKRDMEKAQG